MSREPGPPVAASEVAGAAEWTRLCALLDDDPQLAPTVRLAIADPASYHQERAAELGVQTLAGGPDTDPWQALLDGLDDAGALAYLDRGDSGVELAEALTPLPRVVQAGIEFDEVADFDGELPAAIGVADRLLTARGLRIVQLEEDADACPLVVVPAEHVPAILELVAGLGQVARSFP